MIEFLRGSIDGTAQFQLTGRNADELSLLLQLPIERTRTDAGIIVTIQPKGLDSDGLQRYTAEDSGDGSVCLDLFCHDAE